jgi:putative peptidoglycan lipid II flippase
MTSVKEYLSVRLSRHLRNVQLGYQRIAWGMICVATFVLAAKIMGAFKEMTIAWQYGVSDVVDGYLFVLNLVNWPISIWFSVISVVVIPLAVRARQHTPAELVRFRAELLGLSLALGVALGLAAWIGLTFLLRGPWVGLTPGARQAALTAIGPFALLFPLGCSIYLFSVWLMARESYINTLFEGVPALVILLAVLLSSSGSIEPLIWGTVGGSIVQLVMLAISLARRGELQAPRLSRASTQWQGFWKGMGIMIAAQAALSLAPITDQFFAAHLGPGSIATLGYANRIMALILGLGATSIHRATLSVFSSLQAESGINATLRMAQRLSGLMLAVGVPVVLVGWWLAPWAVGVLFQRGAFGAEQTIAVSEVFRYYLLQVPFYLAGIVLEAWVASRSLYRVLLFAAVVGLVIKLISNAILIENYGLNGLAMGTSVLYFVNFLILFFTTHYFRRRRLAL